MALGDGLSGTPNQVGVHLALIATPAALALVGLFRMRGLPRAATLGLALWLTVILSDSMRLQGQLSAEAVRFWPDHPRCLAIGPQGLPPTKGAPLMGLTTPKPIILRIDDPQGPRFWRWSFRYHDFVRGGIDPEVVHCTPTLPLDLP